VITVTTTTQRPHGRRAPGASDAGFLTRTIRTLRYVNDEQLVMWERFYRIGGPPGAGTNTGALAHSGPVKAGFHAPAPTDDARGKQAR
jgi:hypothetical protein